MALLMVIYTVCASRTNLPFFLIFASLLIVFALLAAAYWKLGEGNEAMGNRLTVVSFEFRPVYHGLSNWKF